MTTALSVSSLVTSAIFAIYKRKPVIIIVGLPAMLRGFASGVFLFFSFFLRPFSQFKEKNHMFLKQLKMLRVNLNQEISIISLQ